MNTTSRHYMRGLHKAELVAAVTFASLSFGAFSKAEKERALAERLGTNHPAHTEVLRRAELPEGLGKTFVTTAIVVGIMGAVGLARSKREE